MILPFLKVWPGLCCLTIINFGAELWFPKGFHIHYSVLPRNKSMRAVLPSSLPPPSPHPHPTELASEALRKEIGLFHTARAGKLSFCLLAESCWFLPRKCILAPELLPMQGKGA